MVTDHDDSARALHRINRVTIVPEAFRRGLCSMRETESTTALLTIRDIATILHCSKTHAARLLEGRVRGAAPLSHIKLGRRKVVRRLIFDRWLLANESSPNCDGGGITERDGNFLVPDRR